MSLKRRVENEGKSSHSSQREKYTDKEQRKSEGKGKQKVQEEHGEQDEPAQDSHEKQEGSIQDEEVYDSQGEDADSQESFDILERHPKFQSYYNYFVADSKKRFSITDNNSWTSSNGTKENILQTLMTLKINLELQIMLNELILL
ncbi:hypothetical protein BDF21DRAFT_418864 [Thamnidium elegans]|nr:hypothetical protein BDF21DRAFT_418864 [Thamnidium elegans]